MTVLDIQRTLQRIISTSETIYLKSNVAPYVTYEDANVISATLNLQPASITLPSYPSILDDLIEDGVPVELSKKLSAALSSATNELKERTEAKCGETWREIVASSYRMETSLSSVASIQNQLLQTFEVVYWRKCKTWADDVRRRANTLQQRTDDNSQSDYNGRQPHFNHEYLPVLEAFFLQEKFPSRADKILLAKKSEMSYKQIHVWFQNRRSRSKRTRTSSLSDTLVSTDVDDESSMVSSSRSASVTLIGNNQLNHSVPSPYGFPMKYPPDFEKDTDPFPCRFGDFSCFSKTSWDSRNTPLCIAEHVVPDIDTLCRDFSQLRISDAPSVTCAEPQPSRIWGESRHRRLTGCDVTAHYTVRPPCAPLVAFIRNPSRHRGLRPCTSFKIRPQHRDGLRHSWGLNSWAQSSTCSSPPQKLSCAVQNTNTINRDFPEGQSTASLPIMDQRKKPRLPRRVPANGPTGQARGTLSTSNAEFESASSLQRQDTNRDFADRGVSVSSADSFASVDTPSATLPNTPSPSTAALCLPEVHVYEDLYLPQHDTSAGDVSQSYMQSLFNYVSSPVVCSPYSAQSFDLSAKVDQVENTLGFASTEPLVYPSISSPLSF